MNLKSKIALAALALTAGSSAFAQLAYNVGVVSEYSGSVSLISVNAIDQDLYVNPQGYRVAKDQVIVGMKYSF